MEKPIILQEGQYTEADLNTFKSSQRIWQTLDIIEKQLEELFEISNPGSALLADREQQCAVFVKNHLGSQPNLKGNWVYFPWSGELIHMLTADEHQLLLTNRNRNLITKEEQLEISKFRVGIVGLSIGNSLALTLAHGGFRNFVLADFDVLSTANLNRIRASVVDIGVEKINITCRQIYKLNPYADLTSFNRGLKEQDLDTYFNESAPNLILEVIDDFAMKIRIRQRARQLGIPVIMPTSLGDSVLFDVERYDLDPQLPIFNGLIGSTPEDILSGPISESDKQRYAIAIVGRENVPDRAIQSVMEINKTLVGRPQLMSTVAAGSGITSFIVRQIALKQNLASGRYRFSFEELLEIK